MATDSISRNAAKKRLKALQKSSPGSIGPADNLDYLCERFMKMLHRDFRSNLHEITPHILTKKVALFSKGFGISDAKLLHALMIRGWFEPSAANCYTIRWDLVRK